MAVLVTATTLAFILLKSRLQANAVAAAGIAENDMPHTAATHPNNNAMILP